MQMLQEKIEGRFLGGS